MAAMSTRGELKQHHLIGRRKLGWVMESFRKYAVDFSLKLSTKGNKGNLQLHRTVQEELKDGGSLKVCKDKQQSDTTTISEKEISKMEKMPDEINAMNKMKDGTCTEKLEPISSNKLPPEQVKENHVLNPTRKRIMIRSRL